MADPGNSADPGETAGGEFSPAELDRLEDALDAWTGALDEPVPEDSSLTPALRARLADYRGLMTLARDAMPMQDVSDDLLTGVLAEAHAAPPVRGARRATFSSEAGPSLWERLRRSMLLPGVALAGSAALLLWMVQPGDDAPTIANNDFPMSEATAPARLAPMPTPSPAAPTPAETATLDRAAVNHEASDGAAGGAAPAAMPGAAAPPADDKPAENVKDMDEAKADRKPRPSKKAEEALEPEAPLPGLDDAPPVDSDKEALRDTLDEADALRRSNQCDRAMALYRQAFDMSGPANERAQARGGYGLCLQAQGEDGDAQKYFDFASKLSSSIDSWIKRERGEGSYSKKAARPSKSSPRKPVAEPLK